MRALNDFRPRVVVDWDGTAVEGVWPEEGRWLPGAAKALRALDELGYEIVIFSCRVAQFAFPSAPTQEEDIPRDPEETAREIAYIKRLLADQDLEHVEVWTRPYKPPGIAYIDDRAVRFDGDWRKVVKAVVNS